MQQGRNPKLGHIDHCQLVGDIEHRYRSATPEVSLDSGRQAAVIGGSAGVVDPNLVEDPALVVLADPAYDAAFGPDDESRLHTTSPHVDVVPMSGAGHNIRGDRATRNQYLDVLANFLTHQTAPTKELQP